MRNKQPDKHQRGEDYAVELSGVLSKGVSLLRWSLTPCQFFAVNALNTKKSPKSRNIISIIPIKSPRENRRLYAIQAKNSPNAIAQPEYISETIAAL